MRVDVFVLEPSEFHISQEIAAAEAAEHAGGVFNPQTQTRISWPENLVEALKVNRDGARNRSAQTIIRAPNFSLSLINYGWMSL